MFNLFKKKKEPEKEPVTLIRNTLFGDMSVNEWPNGNIKGEPWSLFVEARNLIMVQQKIEEAVKVYQKITKMPGLEARHYLQAWFFLRKLGVNPPPEEAAKVYGVLVDVHLASGLELVAGYADHTARYYKITDEGAPRGGIVWEAPDTSLNTKIATLLDACSVIAPQVPPLDNNIRPNPPKQVEAVQICILTPGGLRHGIGTFEGWAKNPTGGPIVAAATDLMTSLVNKRVPG